MDGNATYIGLAHQTGISRNLKTIANNVANMSTDGFLNQKVRFENQVQEIADSAVPDPDGTGEAQFPLDRSTVVDTSPGPIQQTGNPLDVAVKGDAFLAVQGENGENRLTRNGHLTRDNQNRLIHTPSGRPVQNQGGGAIVLPPDAGKVTIASDGTITTQDGVIAGQIGTFNVENPGFLEPEGDTLYATTDETGNAQPAPNATVVQGAVEGSNVEPIREVTDMIQVQRSYQRASQMMKQLDSQASRTIRTLGS